MPLLKKDKLMSGFGKAVDAVNNTADRAGRYAKEKELDKKLDNAVHSLESGARKIGREIRDTFSGK